MTRSTIKFIFLIGVLLLSNVGVNAASRTVQLGCEAPVEGNDPLAALAQASQLHAERRFRVTWQDVAFNGDMQDSGTLLYDRTTQTLAYYLRVVSFGTVYRKSYLFSHVTDTTLRQAAARVPTLKSAEPSYPDNFLDVLLRYGARRKKRFDITTRPKPQAH